MISYDSGGKTVKILLMSLILILSVIIICAVVAQEEKTPGMGAAIGASANISGRTRGKDVVLSKITMVCGGLFAVLCLALGFYMNTF